MYLSKLSPSVYFIHQLKRKFSGNFFWEHQMIWDIFDNSADQKRDFLYRREDAPGKQPLYYILSERMPERVNLELDIQTKLFEPQLATGDHLHFSLRANAVVTRKPNNDSNRRIRRDIIEARVDKYKQQCANPKDRPGSAVIHQEAADIWLKRQGECGGFEHRELLVENHSFQKIKKQGDSNHRYFTTLDFRGKLRVTNSQHFIETLINGLGRSKAYGCGLMLVRRV